MHSLLNYFRIYKKYGSSKFKFGIVYIKEAHSTEEDPVDYGNYRIKQHQNIKDRFDSFELTINELSDFIDISNTEKDCYNGKQEILDNFLLFMDTMNDDIFYSFNCYPDRWVVLHKNKLVFATFYLPLFEEKKLEKLDKFLSNL